MIYSQCPALCVTQNSCEIQVEQTHTVHTQQLPSLSGWRDKQTAGKPSCPDSSRNRTLSPNPLQLLLAHTGLLDSQAKEETLLATQPLCIHRQRYCARIMPPSTPGDTRGCRAACRTGEGCKSNVPASPKAEKGTSQRLHCHKIQKPCACTGMHCTGTALPLSAHHNVAQRVQQATNGSRQAPRLECAEQSVLAMMYDAGRPRHTNSAVEFTTQTDTTLGQGCWRATLSLSCCWCHFTAQQMNRTAPWVHSVPSWHLAWPCQRRTWAHSAPYPLRHKQQQPYQS